MELAKKRRMKMNLTVNHIDFDNNYQIELDIDTAIYSYAICYKGKNYKKTFPYGTMRKQVKKEVLKIFKCEEESLTVEKD